jgi:hypothetical protein
MSPPPVAGIVDPGSMNNPGTGITDAGCNI